MSSTEQSQYLRRSISDRNRPHCWTPARTRRRPTLRTEFGEVSSKFKQGFSRGPSGAPDLGVFQRRPSAGLSQDPKFMAWLASSRTRKSSFACELPFEIKAVLHYRGGFALSLHPIGGSAAVAAASGPGDVPRSGRYRERSLSPKRLTSHPVRMSCQKPRLKPGTALAFANKTATVVTIATVAKASAAIDQRHPAACQLDR